MTDQKPDSREKILETQMVIANFSGFTTPALWENDEGLWQIPVPCRVVRSERDSFSGKVEDIDDAWFEARTLNGVIESWWRVMPKPNTAIASVFQMEESSHEATDPPKTGEMILADFGRGFWMPAVWSDYLAQWVVPIREDNTIGNEAMREEPQGWTYPPKAALDIYGHRCTWDPLLPRCIQAKPRGGR